MVIYVIWPAKMHRVDLLQLPAFGNVLGAETWGFPLLPI